MIKELKINNLAIIKDIELEFEEKFTSLTGETGAGKSIILDGISLILGSRANTNVIRQGENKLSIEAVISINDNLRDKISKMYEDIDFSDNDIIIFREISTDGKTKININNKRVTLSTLSNIMEMVVDIVGQNENQYLLNKKYHKELLDAFVNIKDFKTKEIFFKIKEVNNKINELEEERKNIIEKQDYYEFSINEIEKITLYDGIDKELEQEYKLAFNVGRINESMTKISTVLEEIMYPNLKDCIRSLSNLTEFSNIADIKQKLEDAREIFNEINYSIEIQDEEFDIETISNKLNYINKLKNKYSKSIAELLEYKELLKNKLNNIEYSNDEINTLKKEKEALISAYYEEALKLSAKRKEIAENIESKINKQLFDLNMKDANFKVSFNTKAGFFEDGTDDVEFLIKTNRGQDYSRLDKIASGGEISRIMLALKIVFSEVDNLSSLIFDEIDAGISGETVKLVAKKLKELSKNVQVICVTHSPSIAAYSEEQFLIFKTNTETETNTNIKKLNYEERVNEIARIISGEEVTESLKIYVKEMMAGKND